MVGEVGFACAEQTLDSGHQLIVNPDAAHGVVDGRIDHHWGLVRVVVGDLLIHLEEVAVLVGYHILAEALDGVGEVKEYGETGAVDTKALVAALLGST